MTEPNVPLTYVERPVVAAHLFGSPVLGSPRGASEDPFSARFRLVDRGETTPPPPAGGEDCPEPELPTTFVLCRSCGELVPLHAVECPQCGHPHPREIERSA